MWLFYAFLLFIGFFFLFLSLFIYICLNLYKFAEASLSLAVDYYSLTRLSASALLAIQLCAILNIFLVLIRSDRILFYLRVVLLLKNLDLQWAWRIRRILLKILSIWIFLKQKNWQFFSPMFSKFLLLKKIRRLKLHFAFSFNCGILMLISSYSLLLHITFYVCIKRTNRKKWVKWKTNEVLLHFNPQVLNWKWKRNK